MSSWLSSALETFREKSTDALDFVKRDLAEFTTTVKNDTETYINKIKTQEVGDLGINRFVSKLSNSIKSDNTDEKHFQASSSFDRVHTEVIRLQNDESTYLIDPTPIEAYTQWRQTSDFNVESRKGEIAQLLIDAPHVRSFYAHLVPAQTTHGDFWSRYYYRLRQIEGDEARRLQLLQRAKEICTENNDDKKKMNKNDWEESDEETEHSPKVAEPIPIEITQEKLIEITQEKPIEITQENPIEISQKNPVEISQENPIETNNDSTDHWDNESNQVESVTKSDEIVKQDNASDSAQAIVSSTVEKKADSEIGDEWDSWS